MGQINKTHIVSYQWSTTLELYCNHIVSFIHLHKDLSTALGGTIKMMSSMALHSSLSSASLCSSFISQHPKLSIKASPSFLNQSTKPISLNRRTVALAAPETLTSEPVTGIDTSDTPQPKKVT